MNNLCRGFGIISTVDLQGIGPEGTAVGLASLNGAVRDIIGLSIPLYEATDILGLIPIAVAAGFGLLGLYLLIRRKSLGRVDKSLLALGVLYITVIAVYAFFEIVPINYRPYSVEGCLEASYPSSTTLLTVTVMPTAASQLSARLARGKPRSVALILLGVITAIILIGRILSGVHWITDIIGGALAGVGLDLLYGAYVINAAQ